MSCVLLLVVACSRPAEQPRAQARRAEPTPRPDLVVPEPAPARAAWRGRVEADGTRSGGKLAVVVHVPAHEMRGLAEGAQLSVRRGGVTLPATVDRIAPAIDPKRQTVEVRLAPRYDPLVLQPGLTVDVIR